MRDYVIIADSTCDISKEKCEQYGIISLPGHIKTPDGKEYSTVSEWSFCTKEEFYSLLRTNPNDFATSPPNSNEFAEAFEKAVKSGKDVICLTISGGISGAIGFANLARQEVLKKYPDASIVCIDSMRFGPGFGLLVCNMAKLKAEGKTLEEVVSYAENNKNRYHQCGWLDDLSFVAKKGRMTHAKAFMGTLVGIKPIGEFDYNGLTTVIGKVKGAKNAYNVLINYMKETIEDASEQTLVIAQTDRYDAALKYKELIEKEINPKSVEIDDVFPSCGANIGPGLMAAYYVGTPISEGLEKEKAIIDKYVSEV